MSYFYCLIWLKEQCEWTITTELWNCETIKTKQLSQRLDKALKWNLQSFWFEWSWEPSLMKTCSWTVGPPLRSSRLSPGRSWTNKRLIPAHKRRQDTDCGILHPEWSNWHGSRPLFHNFCCCVFWVSFSTFYRSQGIGVSGLALGKQNQTKNM